MIERDKQNEKYAQAFKRIWLSDDGKVLDEFLKTKCNVEKSSVCYKQPDALQTMFAEGMRKVYLDIMWYINRGFERQDE